MNRKKADILNKIKFLLEPFYPDARVLLYGSHARGDANPGSDWDILVILDKQKIEHSDYEKITYPLYELGWQEDELISVKLYTKTEWQRRSFTPFYKNVEQESIVL
jgi:uncharacterized protein